MKKTIARTNGGSTGLFVNALQEAYGMEHHQLVLFPLLRKAASSLTLQNMMARSLYSTRDQLSRLEEALSLLGQRRKAVAPAATPAVAREAMPAVRPEAMRPVVPEAMLALAREAEELIGGTIAGSATRDTGLVMVVQKIRQYEISVYAELAEHARLLEHDEVLDLIEASLFEERESEEILRALAGNYIDIAASRE